MHVKKKETANVLDFWKEGNWDVTSFWHFCWFNAILITGIFSQFFGGVKLFSSWNYFLQIKSVITFQKEITPIPTGHNQYQQDIQHKMKIHFMNVIVILFLSLTPRKDTSNRCCSILFSFMKKWRHRIKMWNLFISVGHWIFHRQVYASCPISRV